jgi:hypothetical protein
MKTYKGLGWLVVGLQSVSGWVDTLPRPLSQPEAPAVSQPTLAPAPSYVTTMTIYSSTLISTTHLQMWISPRFEYVTSWRTVTSLIPGPVTQVPATVTCAVITHGIIERTTVFLDISATFISTSTYTATVPETWVVAPSQATHVPAGTSPSQLRCSDCVSSNPALGAPEENLKCVSKGLQTGCQGQCQLREDGNFWCLQLYYQTWTDPLLRMGRACWGGKNRYEQLNTPCIAGDYGVACTPCHGLNAGWVALNWTGPGSNSPGPPG